MLANNNMYRLVFNPIQTAYYFFFVVLSQTDIGSVADGEGNAVLGFLRGVPCQCPAIARYVVAENIVKDFAVGQHSAEMPAAD